MSDALTEAAAVARRHHAGLKPFLANPLTLPRAARFLSHETVGLGKVLYGPDHPPSLCFVPEGAAVVTLPVSGERPESVRTLAGPFTLGARSFALGGAPTASVVATRTCSVLRLTPERFEGLSRDNATVAVGLLRWASHDVIDWLWETRTGTDAWSRRNEKRGHAVRTFETPGVEREVLEIAADVRDAAAEAMAAVAFLDRPGLAPMASALGDAVQLVVVRAGEALVQHQARDGDLYVLLDGRAHVPGRAGRVLGRFSAGGSAAESLIGEVSWLSQTGRDGTVVADTDALFLAVPRVAVGWMLQKHPALAVQLHRAVLATLCTRLEEADAERRRIAGA